MAIITLRNIKGSPLTIAEMDNNFTNLNIEIGNKIDSGVYTAADVLAKLLTVDTNTSGLNATSLKGNLPDTTNTANTIVSRDPSGNFAAGTITANLSGNASTVTNGLYSNQLYVDPSWIVSLSPSKVGLGNVTNESKTTLFTNTALTGTPTAPTASFGTNNNQIATTAFVETAIDSVSAGTVQIDWTAPVMQTPTLGTPTSGNLSNCSYIPVNQAIGTLSANNLALSGVSPGSYTTANITVDNKGRVTSASNGTVSISLPAGTVLKVAQSVKSDEFSSTSTSYVDVPGLAVSITPASTSNKILVLLSVAVGSHYASPTIGGGDPTPVPVFIQLNRNDVPIALGNSSGNTSQATIVGTGLNDHECNTMTIAYYDTPSTTSATTYKIKVKSLATSNASAGSFINRAYYNGNIDDVGRPISTITVMEIAG